MTAASSRARRTRPHRRATTIAPGQLTFDFTANPVQRRNGRRPGRRPQELDLGREAVVTAQRREEEQAWRAARAPAPCRCPNALDAGEGRCVWCGRHAGP